MPMNETIFSVDRLTKIFPAERRLLVSGRGRSLRAVDEVSFDVRRGETFGIVGESGCGKTTLARLMLKLIPSTSGAIFFEDRDITGLGGSEMKKLRRRIQMIFQDPYSSLDPRHSVFSIVSEPLRVHGTSTSRSKEDRVREVLGLVGLPGTDDFLWKVPDALSGGERQRLGVARAIVGGADFIVADEPVSMLDSSVKASIASLLIELKKERNLTYLFITHEIGLAYHLCDRIAVMFGGRIVELAGAEEVIHAPLHPYTRLLMDAVPPLSPGGTWAGAMAQGLELPPHDEHDEGCGFYSRCLHRKDVCGRERPVLMEVEGDHHVACHD